MALSDLLRMCKKDPYRRTLYAFNIWNSSSTYAFNTDVRIEHLAGTVIKLRTHCEDTSQARTECRSGATTLAPTSDSRPRRQARYARCVCFLSADLSWLPEFCTTARGRSGVWARVGVFRPWTMAPNVTGDYPEACGATPRPANLQKYADIIPTTSLIQHE